MKLNDTWNFEMPENMTGKNNRLEILSPHDCCNFQSKTVSSFFDSIHRTRSFIMLCKISNLVRFSVFGLWQKRCKKNCIEVIMNHEYAHTNKWWQPSNLVFNVYTIQYWWMLSIFAICGGIAYSTQYYCDYNGLMVDDTQKNRRFTQNNNLTMFALH